jgi:hypothetical protein
MEHNIIKCKTFFGTCNETADLKFNAWIEMMNSNFVKVNIKEFIYRQARFGDHSICILYEEIMR